MKNFEDFMRSLDAETFAKLEGALMDNPYIENAPTEDVKRHIEIGIIASVLIGKYHEWLNS